jgi:hydroxymethylglutaryl-CoA lyase
MTWDAITIREVAPRDGLQDYERVLPTADKARLIKRMHSSGLRWIEATSFVSPKRVPQLADAAELCAALAELELAGLELSAFAATSGGMQRATAAGVAEISTTVPATDSMTKSNFGRDRGTMLREVIEMRAGSPTAMSVTIAVSFACPFEGRVPAGRVLDLVDSLAQGGYETILLGDTIGFANPRSVSELVSDVVQRFPSLRIGAHFHDARGAGIANVVAAAQAGATMVDGSLGGIGGCPFAPGAAGNVATEDAVWVLEEAGFATGLDPAAIADAARWMQSELEIVTCGRAAGATMFEWEAAA